MKRFLLIGILLLSGCSANLNQQFATGYGLNKVSRNINTSLLKEGKISYADAIRVRKIEDETLTALDVAWNVKAISADSAKTQVDTVNSTLAKVLKSLEKIEGVSK